MRVSAVVLTCLVAVGGLVHCERCSHKRPATTRDAPSSAPHDTHAAAEASDAAGASGAAGAPTQQRPAFVCSDELALPMPACVRLSEMAFGDIPLLAPQVIRPGTLRIVVPADRIRETSQLAEAALGRLTGAEYAIIDVTTHGDQIVHVGRCPSDAGYLAAFSVDAGSRLHLLCLEYTTESQQRLPVQDPASYAPTNYCRGPRAWAGTVESSTSVSWNRTGWLADLCEQEIRRRVVLGITATAAIVAYCAPVEMACEWRAAVLGRPSHSLRVIPDDAGDETPAGFAVGRSALEAIVPAPSPEQEYESSYSIVSLDSADRLRRAPLSSARPKSVPSEAFPRVSALFSPGVRTSWVSDDGETSSLLLPLFPLASEQSSYDPLAISYSMKGRRPVAGFRALGPAIKLLPFADGEAESARIELPGGSLLELDDRPLQWLRATCADSCLVSYRYLDGPGQRVPALFYVIRILVAPGAAAGLQELGAGSRCTADESGELQCVHTP